LVNPKKCHILAVENQYCFEEIQGLPKIGQKHFFQLPLSNSALLLPFGQFLKKKYFFQKEADSNQ
jgi:hypothetical protein